LISCFLIIFTPVIPAIEYNTINNSIKLDINNITNHKIILNENLLKLILNPLIDIILLLLQFIMDLTNIFIAIIITIFDYISLFLIDLSNLINEIQNPFINIILSFLTGIYVLLMFTCLVLVVQFTGIIVIIYLLIEKLLLP